MAIPVLVRSVGPTPAGMPNYYTDWTNFVPGYPKFQNQDTGISQAVFGGDGGTTVIAYRAYYRYFTGNFYLNDANPYFVTRLIYFEVAQLPETGEYYDIPVESSQASVSNKTGGTGFNPRPEESQNTAQPSGPSALDVVVTESFALSTGDARVTDWRTPRSIRQLSSGTQNWINKDGAKLRDDGVAASKTLEATDAYKLVGQDFGFSLPNASKVIGVEVETVRAGTGVTAETVELVLGGKSESVGSPWDIESATKDDDHFLDVSSQGTDSVGIVFADSTTLLVRVATAGNDKLLRYDLGAPWDITTATLGNALDTGGSSEFGCTIGGGKYYTKSGSLIFQYAVSGDYTSLTFEKYKNINAQTVSPSDILFSPDGSKMFVLEGPDIGYSRIYQYDLSVAFDIETAVYSGVSLYGGSAGVGAYMRFRSDGLALYALNQGGATSSDIRQWDLPSAYSLSGASLSASFDLGSASSTGMDFSDDGNFLFFSDYGANKIYRYAMQASSTELVEGHLYDEGYTFPDASTYAHTYGTLFSGLGSPPPDLTARALVKGGVDALAGMALTYADVNNISFGVAYTAQGAGRSEVDGLRMRIYYRADISNDTLPAKRSNGLSGVAESPEGVKVTVGVDGKIMRKPANDPTWVSVNSGTTVSLNAVEWVGDRFIAVGLGGIALDGGADGSAWTRVQTGAATSLWAIRRIPDTLRAVAVGNDDLAFERSRLGVWSV